MILVREARDTDLPAIATLHAQVALQGAASYLYEALDEAGMRRPMHAVLDAGLPCLVAKLDGVFGGYAYASAYRDWAGYRWTVEDTADTTPRCAGRGVGTALLGRLIAQCELRGFRQMAALFGVAASEASVALHRKHGFETVGIFKGLGSRHGRWLANLRMQRALGAGCSHPLMEP